MSVRSLPCLPVVVGSLVVPTLLLGVACRPAADPEPSTPALESLRDGQYDGRFGLEYWTEQLDARETDDEWGRAVEFCSGVEVERYPNCRAVRLLHTASKVPGFPAPHEGGFVP